MKPSTTGCYDQLARVGHVNQALSEDIWWEVLFDEGDERKILNVNGLQKLAFTVDARSVPALYDVNHLIFIEIRQRNRVVQALALPTVTLVCFEMIACRKNGVKVVGPCMSVLDAVEMLIERVLGNTRLGFIIFLRDDPPYHERDKSEGDGSTSKGQAREEFTPMLADDCQEPIETVFQTLEESRGVFLLVLSGKKTEIIKEADLSRRHEGEVVVRDAYLDAFSKIDTFPSGDARFSCCDFKVFGTVERQLFRHRIPNKVPLNVSRERGEPNVCQVEGTRESAPEEARCVLFSKGERSPNIDLLHIRGNLG